MIAPGRARRPGAARGDLDPPSDEEVASCPFCEGREDRTPPETLALPERDGRSPDSPGWLVRVVPNLYPAFERQEVVVHAPHHARSLAELSEDELALVAAAWQARARVARAEGAAYVHALVNEGREAGASLAHSHSQLVWLPQTPPAVLEELEHSGGACSLCALLADERERGERVVAERDGLVLLCPYAGRVPYELLLAPIDHEEDGLASERLAPALALLGDAVRRLRAVDGPRPLNAWLHNGVHWHLEVVPRLSIFAGLELGAGYYVNTLAPEEAAAALRSAL